MPGLAAEAVLLRQEVVVLADKPGRVNEVLAREPGGIWPVGNGSGR